MTMCQKCGVYSDEKFVKGITFIEGKGYAVDKKGLEKFGCQFDVCLRCFRETEKELRVKDWCEKHTSNECECE